MQYPDANGFALQWNIGYRETLVASVAFFLKLMRQITRCHLHQLLVLSVYYIICREGSGRYCEMSAMVTGCVSEPARWFCDSLCNW